MDEEILILKFIINAHHSILLAVRRLPPEILGEIFLLALPDVDYIDSDVAEHIKGTHGCCLMRIIHTFREDEHPLRALETQITLSDNAPLFVYFWMSRDTEGNSPEFSKFFELVLGQSSRWQQLKVCWSGRASALHLLSCLTDQLAHLQRLVFHPYGFRYQLPPALGSLVALAPSLREALLTSNDFTDPSPPLDLPWHQLTRLRLRSSHAYIVENLPKAPLPTDIAFVGELTANVRRLTLCEAPENWLKLDTPLLEHLHLQSCKDIVFQIMIHPMLGLRSLKLTNIAMSDVRTPFSPSFAVSPQSLIWRFTSQIGTGTQPHRPEQHAFILSFATAMKISNESMASSLSPMLTSLRLVFPYLYPQSDELDHSFFEMVQSR
ncbi:hypothetical protein R3P38DRAFT_3234120 [Favolaschia claudopus]|uniref:F-box domain-containing protein n=1 Tax=Favolaschia claudopus TaxID=2862362 RepID=A0AAV9ZH70_9AGAR